MALRWQLGEPRGLARSLYNLSDVVNALGEHRRAVSLYQEALALRRAPGDTGGVASSSNYLGEVARDQGDLPAARRWFEQRLA